MENDGHTKKGFETRFSGGLFIASALLLLIGWILLPHKLGEYIVYDDFAKVGENVWFWIWMYRIHIFGWVTMALALLAFMGLTVRHRSRVMVFPGAGMAILGTFTLALAAAYFYNHGAWGVGQTAGKSPEEIDAFMENLLFTNQYVTCFIRFGRIFSGVGLIILGAAFLKWKMFPSWLSLITTLLGLIAMCVILFIPDNFEVYKPIFYIKAAWLAAMGLVILKRGLYLSGSE